MYKILVISSQIHQTLSKKQLEYCTKLLDTSPYSYDTEILPAGVYEIPFVINTFMKKNIFDAYIVLGLVIKANNDHFDYIMSHIKACFTHFALNDIIIGNGIVCGESVRDLSEKIESHDPCIGAYSSAYNAVHALLSLKERLSDGAQ